MTGRRFGQRRPGLGSLLLMSLMAVSMLLSACNSSAKHVVHRNYITVVANASGDYTQSFNPYNTSNLTTSQGVIYETLLFFNRGDESITPWLASGYQYSSDLTQVTFTIRSGVKWSDGQPFSSDDVVFTLNLLKKYPAMDLNGLWNQITSVTAPDPSTVVVKLKAPFTPLLWSLGGQTYMLPKHIWSTVGDASTYADANPVGTGPYKLKSFTPQLVVLTKNPNFWQADKVKVQEVRYPAFDSNTSAELAMNSGTVDWAAIYTPDIQKTYVNRDPAHNHYWFPPSDILMLFVNTAKYPFNQLAVRKALSLAIDRNKLSKVAESGYEPLASPAGIVLPNDQKFMAPQYANLQFTMDTNAAQQQLASAGFTKGSDGIYADKNGKKLSMRLDVVTGFTDWITGAQIIASNLKALGIDVNVNTISQDAWQNNLSMGTFDISLCWTNPGPSPYFIFDALLRSTNSAPVGQAANSNYERWNDPAVDRLLDQFAQSNDLATQQQAMAGIEQVMVDQLPSIPLLNEPYWYEYNTSSYVGWPDAGHLYAEPSPYAYPDDEIVLLHLQPAS
ncbi:MAG TPA: ABC transporter substrate-binding protein [Ktedonobacterales bacterium]|nr:ABC transporter substrate-binding protein [Ktedonobacterales bacterium]